MEFIDDFAWHQILIGEPFALFIRNGFGFGLLFFLIIPLFPIFSPAHSVRLLRGLIRVLANVGFDFGFFFYGQSLDSL